jgi:hypothetical protein
MIPHVRLLSRLRPQTHYLSRITHVDAYRRIPSSLPMPIVVISSLPYTLTLRPSSTLVAFTYIYQFIFLLRPGLLLVLAWSAAHVKPISQPLLDFASRSHRTFALHCTIIAPFSYFMCTHPFFCVTPPCSHTHHSLFSLSPTPSFPSRMIWANIYSVAVAH